MAIAKAGESLALSSMIEIRVIGSLCSIPSSLSVTSACSSDVTSSVRVTSNCPRNSDDLGALAASAALSARFRLSSKATLACPTFKLRSAGINSERGSRNSQTNISTTVGHARARIISALAAHHATINWKKFILPRCTRSARCQSQSRRYSRTLAPISPKCLRSNVTACRLSRTAIAAMVASVSEMC